MFRLSLRFLLPLLISLTILIYLLLPLVDRMGLKWARRDLELRSHLVAASLQESLVQAIESRDPRRIQALFNRISRDERLLAIGLCGNTRAMQVKAGTFPADLSCDSSELKKSEAGTVLEASGGPIHIASIPIFQGNRNYGSLVIVQDLSFVTNRSTDTKRYIFYLFILIACLISVVTVVVAQISWKGWISGIRALLRGEGLIKPLGQPIPKDMQPILKEMRSFLRELRQDARSSDSKEIWTPRSLKELLQQQLAGEEMLIVSNREPYLHVFKDDKIQVQFPASGLVSALEPIMRACSGTWIAHGSGSADRAVVDEHSRVRVPPDSPAYQIRRVWLSEAEENGYYFGFANEGLWPLCHIAHVRPTFRTEDWNQYKQVNQKFAEVVVEEARTEDPVILVQDYHFALLPAYIRERLPKATIITFWHIPWPNPEAFGICPWREEILKGLLGSSVVGFHTRYHCNNFLDTVDRFLECRIERESSTVIHSKKLTAVRNYPISIEWPPRWIKDLPPAVDCRKLVAERHELAPGIKIGIGVDRLDYTKGILERFLSVERLFELHPEWIGKFIFIQIAAPSREKIARYRLFHDEVNEVVNRINERFGKTILLLEKHHEPRDVYEYFRAADLCFVSSLHDGMNLVAKEYVAAREDEQGVLILSLFAGASRELVEALVVNPYNIDQCAEALNAALRMDVYEQRARMRSMRTLVQEYNVFRWAGRMLSDAARLKHRYRLSQRVEELDFLERGISGV